MEAKRRITKGKRAEVQPLVEKVVRVVREQVANEGLRIFLFGSWAEGRALAVSDLDIGLDAGEAKASAPVARILDWLAVLPTLRKIDLIDVRSVNQEFRGRVLEHGELIFGK